MGYRWGICGQRGFCAFSAGDTWLIPNIRWGISVPPFYPPSLSALTSAGCCALVSVVKAYTFIPLPLCLRAHRIHQLKLTHCWRGNSFQPISLVSWPLISKMAWPQYLADIRTHSGKQKEGHGPHDECQKRIGNLDAMKAREAWLEMHREIPCLAPLFSLLSILSSSCQNV